MDTVASFITYEQTLNRLKDKSQQRVDFSWHGLPSSTHFWRYPITEIRRAARSPTKTRAFMKTMNSTSTLKMEGKKPTYTASYARIES